MLPDRASDWASLLYMALIPGALAIVGQTWAQAHLPPTRTAIVMSMEPVFAAFFAVLLGGESLTSRMLLGGALVLAAMLVVELGAAPQGRGRGHPPDGLTGPATPIRLRIHATSSAQQHRRIGGASGSGWRKR